MSVNYNPKIVTSNLMFYLDTNNPKGFTSPNVWYNLMNTQVTGTRSSNYPQVSNGNMLIGTANEWNFFTNSSSLYVSKTQNYTVSAAVKPSLSPTGSGVIFEKWNGGVAPYPYTVRFLKGITAFQIAAYDGTTNPDVRSAAIDYDQWYYITGVFDWANTTLTMFINGEQANSSTLTTANSVSSTTVAYIGARNANSAVFRGEIGPISLHDRALSVEEIKQNFNAIRGRFGI